MKNTTLYSTCCNSTTTCDCEYVLNWHQERFVSVTNRIRNILINSVHEFHDLVAPLAGSIFKSLKSRTLDDRNVISRELILVQKVSDVHLNKLKKLRIINHITFVHEYYDVRYTYLTSKKNVLLCLSHNTVCSSNNEDSTIHLCSTSDHVLYIVSVARAVNVCIVTFCCLILNVCCGDRDTTCSLFRSFVDVIECYELTKTKSFMESFCDCSCQCCFTMVYVSDGTNIAVRFCSFEFSFCHFVNPPKFSTPMG